MKRKRESFKGTIPEHYSHNKITNYDRCPKWYFHHYRRQAESEGSIEMTFGLFIHEVAERIHKFVKETGQAISPDDSKRIYDERFKGQYEKKLSGSWYIRGYKALLVYCESLVETNVFKSEVELATMVAGRKIIGKIDRLDVYPDKAVIYDIKSGMQIPKKDELQNDLQFDIYAVLVRDNLLPQVPKIECVHYAFMANIPVKIEKTEEEIEATRRYLGKIFKRIENDTKYEPRLSRFCYECPVRCSKFKQFLLKTQDRDVLNAVLKSDHEELENQWKQVMAPRRLLLEKKEDQLKTLFETEVVKAGGELMANGTLYAIEKKHRVTKPSESWYTQLVAHKLGKKGIKNESEE